MRQFYGERYVDYLAAIGVKVPWTIQENSEPIGKKHADWRFVPVADTTSVDTGNERELGYSGGFFKGKTVLDLRPTFCPEHGLIAVMCVVRADPLYTRPAMGAHMMMIRPEDFWSPEYDTRKQFDYSNNLYEQQINDVRDTQRPAWEHLRKGSNENRADDTSSLAPETVLGFHVDTTSSDNQINPSFYDDSFDLTSLAYAEHYQSTADWRVTRRSPVMRHGQQKPVF